MAGRIDSMTKKRLQEHGLWGEFLARRDELRLEGYSPADARQMAAMEFLSECDDTGNGDGGHVRCVPGIDALASRPEALAGKVATESESIRWVARNIDNPDVSPEDCPDPFAWTLLRLCRETPTFRGFFTEKLWGRLIPTRTQQETEKTTGELDGQPILDLIARIQAVREEVTGGEPDAQGAGRASTDGVCR